MNNVNGVTQKTTEYDIDTKQFLDNKKTIVGSAFTIIESIRDIYEKTISDWGILIIALVPALIAGYSLYKSLGGLLGLILGFCVGFGCETLNLVIIRSAVKQYDKQREINPNVITLALLAFIFAVAISLSIVYVNWNIPELAILGGVFPFGTIAAYYALQISKIRYETKQERDDRLKREKEKDQQRQWEIDFKRKQMLTDETHRKKILASEILASVKSSDMSLSSDNPSNTVTKNDTDKTKLVTKKKRIVTILEEYDMAQLVTNYSDIVSELSQKFSVSERTIKRDIAEIKKQQGVK